MKKRLLTLVMTTVLVLGITACGGSSTNTGNTGNAGNNIAESMVAEMEQAEPTAEPTPAPTEAPTPEPTAEPTPEPTEAPFMMPEVPTVYINDITIELPCELTEVANILGDSVECKKAYGISYHTNDNDEVYDMSQNEVLDENCVMKLPGDMYCGKAITIEEVIALYGEPDSVDKNSSIKHRYAFYPYGSECGYSFYYYEGTGTIGAITVYGIPTVYDAQ